MEEDQKWGAADKSKVGRTCNEFYPCKKPFWRNCKDLSAITVCIALSVLSFGVCLLVFLRTSDLHSRILNLEKQRETQVSAWISLEQVEPVILGRLDQILEEKLAARLPKTREARDATQSCVCPPGPPGSRGKRGREGDPVRKVRPPKATDAPRDKLALLSLFIQQRLAKWKPHEDYRVIPMRGFFRREDTPDPADRP
ncbi:collagen alpha-1(XXV) chain-like [Osmerus eperlanus]|uniref:collagen alpha-1(XXV) chain-like n=1 Tax=Osmerus eperlanus TaxID=29151 RepID=UPI002E100EE2